ncbi:hypothetical protein I3F60_01280 [Streptomyces sp. MUM 136J]|uniref:hypothetical protein n=1 Tax=Streptomyces sp. MUM 136J TaxID=2791992 RepID=UPI001F049D7B|nr:hypothetical protein [Streptomyces sp. MUM 136J]MCH0567911.1 hypothetical protein [Streptomyces sp. MUM 136J]
MRLSRNLASVTVAATLLLCLPYDPVPHARVRSVPPAAGQPAVPEQVAAQPFGSECRVHISGSHVVAHCHNPYVGTDRVRLHIECARWWDIDTDTSPADAGPAATVRLSGRCWKEVRTAWVSHQRQGS